MTFHNDVWRRLAHGGVALLLAMAGCATPHHVYLTWQGDTSTTMTINYHTGPESAISAVHYDTQSRSGVLNAYRYEAEGAAHTIPGLVDGRLVHTVELTGLTPGQTYYFGIEAPGETIVREFRFRTMPAGGPVRFIAGGDMGISELARELMARAAEFEPDFALIGGDIAYANGNLGSAGKWDEWLDNWETVMRRKDGALIPIVAAIGNHETNSKEGTPEVRAPFYLGYLAQGGSTYFARTFGDNLAVFVLDSGHIAPHGGAQAAWLAEALPAYAAYPHKAAVYHVPLYPSHRSFDGALSAAGRANWLPLFDANGLDVAFENHDHTFKRTIPLRGNQPDPAGIVYLGDGDFGRPPRTADQAGAWYLEKASGTAHFWVIDVTTEQLRCRAVNGDGEVFDEYLRTEEVVPNGAR